VSDAVSLTAYSVRESAEDLSESIRNRRWAAQAWDQTRDRSPETAYSPDYERGFEDGFTHYLYRGGTGEPPPLPPRRYRWLRYQTPQGYRAIEDWYAGFRQGADVARQSGYRRWVTGPSALTASAHDVPLREPCADDNCPTMRSNHE
jgi:hypothetical protein